MKKAQFCEDKLVYVVVDSWPSGHPFPYVDFESEDGWCIVSRVPNKKKEKNPLWGVVRLTSFLTIYTYPKVVILKNSVVNNQITLVNYLQVK